jgi:hypothetical protein
MHDVEPLVTATRSYGSYGKGNTSVVLFAQREPMLFLNSTMYWQRADLKLAQPCSLMASHHNHPLLSTCAHLQAVPHCFGENKASGPSPVNSEPVFSVFLHMFGLTGS